MERARAAALAGTAQPQAASKRAPIAPPESTRFSLLIVQIVFDRVWPDRDQLGGDERLGGPLHGLRPTLLFLRVIDLDLAAGAVVSLHRHLDIDPSVMSC